MRHHVIGMLGVLAFFGQTTHGVASVTSEPSWTLIHDEDGVKSYRKELPDSRTVAFRGEATLPMSPIRILTILSNVERYTEWNKNIKKLVLLERKSISERIQYMETFVPFPYQNREVVVHIKTSWNPEMKAIAVESHSVDDPRAPADTGCVRANVIFSRYFLKPSPDWTSTDMSLEIHADPMGNIPGWLVNIFQKNWPRKTFRALTERASDPTVVNLPEIKAYIAQEARRLGVKIPDISKLEN